MADTRLGTKLRSPKRFIVVGLGFGDEGKGTLTDYLARKHDASAVVRFNGGAQAGHRVVTDDGREHVFAQFGSGTFHPGCETYLSKHMIVNPLNLLAEEEHLRTVGVADAFDRLFIDVEALIVTPFHIAANRLRELARGANRYGSCGQGIGEAVSDSLRAWPPSIRAGDLFFEYDLLEKLRWIQRRKRNVYEHLHSDPDIGESERYDLEQEGAVLFDDSVPEMLAELYAAIQPNVVSDWRHRLRDDETIIFEGAQGVLLDENWGFQPHTTWSTTTSANAHRLLDTVGFDGERRTIGVTRGYATRHGAGPFPTESPKWSAALRDVVGNQKDPWQGGFRVGPLDLPLLHYAIECDGRIDEIAMTCLDRLPVEPRFSIGYERDVQLGLPRSIANAKPVWLRHNGTPDSFATIVGNSLEKPVSIRSWGPTAGAKT